MRHVYIEFCTKTYGSRILDARGQMIPLLGRVLFQMDLNGESTCRLCYTNGQVEDCTWSPYRVVDLQGNPVTEWGTLTNRPQLPAPQLDCADCGDGGMP